MREIESGTTNYHTAVLLTTDFETRVKTLKCCKDKSIALVGRENPNASTTWLEQNQYLCCYLSVKRAYRIWSCPTPSLKPKFGTVTLLVVCISHEHLKRICFKCGDVKAAKEKWFRENRAEFCTSGIEKLIQRWRHYVQNYVKKVKYSKKVHMLSYILGWVAFR
jgi:hypothetical protein